MIFFVSVTYLYVFNSILFMGVKKLSEEVKEIDSKKKAVIKSFLIKSSEVKSPVIKRIGFNSGKNFNFFEVFLGFLGLIIVLGIAWFLVQPSDLNPIQNQLNELSNSSDDFFISNEIVSKNISVKSNAEKGIDLSKIYSVQEVISKPELFLGKEFLINSFIARSSTCPKVVCVSRPCCNGCFESLVLTDEKMQEEEYFYDNPLKLSGMKTYLLILGEFNGLNADCSGNKCHLQCNPELLNEKQFSAEKHEFKVKLIDYSNEFCYACEEEGITPEYYLELIEVLD